MRKNVASAVLCLLVGLGAGYALGEWRHGSLAPRAPEIPPVDEVATAKRVVQTALASDSYRSISSSVAENLVIWSKAEPRAALKALAAANRVPDRNKMLAFPLAELARNDVGAVADWMRANLPDPDRGQVASRLVSILRIDAPRAAVALILERDLKVEESVFPFALGALAKIDPAAAIESWHRLGRVRLQFCLVQIAEGYVAGDAGAAIRWAASFRGTEDEKYAGEGIIRGLIETQPSKVKEAAEQLGLSHAALFAAIDGMAYRAPEGVVATLPILDPIEATIVARTVVTSLMNSNPARALAVARE